MRKSTPVVSSGEAASYDSDSKQTIPGPVGHLAGIEEAVALAASPFSLLQPQRSQGLTDGARIARDPRLVLHHRCPADHFKISNSCGVCQDFIRHAISKESVFGILAEVFEWKDSNTLDRDCRKIADSFLMKNRVADGERDDCKQCSS